MHCWNRRLCRVSPALAKVNKHSAQHFVEYNNRQSIYDKKLKCLLSGTRQKFTEYRSDTRQSKVVVTGRAAVDVQFAECQDVDTRQMPRFVECQVVDTR